LGHFLLTNLLLDLLKRAAPSRVITVSGRSHRPSATEGVRAGTIHLSDLQFEQNYSFERASKQAVLAKILFTYEFARRHTDDRVAATTLCPGLSRTNLVSGLSWPVRAYMAVRYVLQRAQSPEDAARYFMNLIEGKKWQDISGKYFEGDRGGLVEARSSEESYDTELSRLLWEASERLVGQRFP